MSELDPRTDFAAILEIVCIECPQSVPDLEQTLGHDWLRPRIADAVQPGHDIDLGSDRLERGQRADLNASAGGCGDGPAARVETEHSPWKRPGCTPARRGVEGTDVGLRDAHGKHGLGSRSKVDEVCDRLCRGPVTR